MTARGTVRDGSMWNPPGTQQSPAGSGLNQFSNGTAEGIEAVMRGEDCHPKYGMTVGQIHVCRATRASYFPTAGA
jgi:hypothetical protein